MKKNTATYKHLNIFLIDSINVSLEEAHELGNIGKVFPNCHVNLIPVNGNEHINLYKPSVNI